MSVVLTRINYTQCMNKMLKALATVTKANQCFSHIGILLAFGYVAIGSASPVQYSQCIVSRRTYGILLLL